MTTRVLTTAQAGTHGCSTGTHPVPIRSRTERSQTRTTREQIRRVLDTTAPCFPSSAELRQGASGLAATPDQGTTAGEAWQEVKRAISLGQHRFESGLAHWSSPLVEDAFNAVGGWAFFRSALVKNEASDRAYFARAYEQLKCRHRQLAGIHQSARQLRHEPPVMDHGLEHDASRCPLPAPADSSDGALPKKPEKQTTMSRRLPSRSLTLDAQRPTAGEP